MLPSVFFCTIVGLNVTECPPDLISLFLIGLASTFAFIATFTFNNIEDAIEDIKSKSLKNAIALDKLTITTEYF